ncbi:hypothetical protein L6V77_15775 [Myxococcota bacterium]|nr:hypothetical protein [Myxococcota bacterium]
MNRDVRRWGLVTAWTILMGAGLALTDRLIVGPPAPHGFQRYDDLEALAEAAGPLHLPTYFPDGLAWPPVELHAEPREHPTWFMAVSRRASPEIVLWLGATRDGSRAVPAALEGCLDGDTAPCAAGRTRLRRALPDGRTLWAVSTLPAGEVRLILQGLTRGDRPR